MSLDPYEPEMSAGEVVAESRKAFAAAWRELCKAPIERETLKERFEIWCEQQLMEAVG